MKVFFIIIKRKSREQYSVFVSRKRRAFRNRLTPAGISCSHHLRYYTVQNIVREKPGPRRPKSFFNIAGNKAVHTSRAIVLSRKGEKERGKERRTIKITRIQESILNLNCSLGCRRLVDNRRHDISMGKLERAA